MSGQRQAIARVRLRRNTPWPGVVLPAARYARGMPACPPASDYAASSRWRDTKAGCVRAEGRAPDPSRWPCGHHQRLAARALHEFPKLAAELSQHAIGLAYYARAGPEFRFVLATHRTLTEPTVQPARLVRPAEPCSKGAVSMSADTILTCRDCGQAFTFTSG